MKRLFWLLLIALLSFFPACIAANGVRTRTSPPPGIACPSRVIRVAFDPLFSETDRRIGIQALPALKILRVYSRYVTSHPDVTVVYWQGHNCQDNDLGYFRIGGNLVYVDPNCTSGRLQLGAVVVHEIGHWLGLQHVCDLDGKTSDRCSPIGRGSAIMNPYLSLTHEIEPSPLDMQEYRRVCWNRILP